MMAALLLTACQETLEERCEREAREYTEKKCPALITENVTIDSMTFNKSSHTMTYYYTLDGVLDNAEALKEQHGISLEKNRIILEENIKNFGSYEVKCKLGYEISGTIHVLVVEE